MLTCQHLKNVDNKGVVEVPSKTLSEVDCTDEMESAANVLG